MAPVNSIVFHPNGEYLASSSEDELLKLWDLREGRLLYKLIGHKNAVTCCTFAPSGSSFVSGGKDSLVFQWDCHPAEPSPPPSKDINVAHRWSHSTHLGGEQKKRSASCGIVH